MGGKVLRLTPPEPHVREGKDISPKGRWVMGCNYLKRKARMLNRPEQNTPTLHIKHLAMGERLSLIHI